MANLPLMSSLKIWAFRVGASLQQTNTYNLLSSIKSSNEEDTEETQVKKVEDKIIPVDLTSVFKEIGKVREEVAMIDVPTLDTVMQDIKEMNAIITRIEKKLAILEKEKEVLAIEIEEIKLESNNPLSN